MPLTTRPSRERLVFLHQEWEPVREAPSASAAHTANSSNEENRPVDPPINYTQRRLLSLAATIARDVRHERLVRRWTVPRLAEKTRVRTSRLLELERGEGEVSLDLVTQLEVVFGRTLLPRPPV